MKSFEVPELEVTTLIAEDVITTSTEEPVPGGNGSPIG